MHIEVYGNPHGKGRPRLTARGGRAVVYTDKKTKEYEKKIEQAAIRAADGRSFEGPVRLMAAVYMPIPASATKQRKADMRAGKIPHLIKPDLDNVLKSIIDGIQNAKLLTDDKQVTEIIAMKRYDDGEGARVVIDIEENGED